MRKGRRWRLEFIGVKFQQMFCKLWNMQRIATSGIATDGLLSTTTQRNTTPRFTGQLQDMSFGNENV